MEKPTAILLPIPRKLTAPGGAYRTAGQPPKVVIDPSILKPQGYRISVGTDGILVTAGDAAGAFYARQTIAQLQIQFGDSLPSLEIEDWPDFAVRGVMLDISRDKVPTMATLSWLIDLLASWKINQLQLYTEHTFAYAHHQTVWENASPMTAEQIRQLDAYCKARFIELVPNQNSFGHMERWLKHRQYQQLAEAIDGADTPWGFRWKGPFSLCPTDRATLKLLGGLYAELLPNFSSPFFNVGCDETFDIGQGRSKPDCDRLGVHRVYLNFLQQVNELVRSNSRTMMFWGDVILHQPELIAELPSDVIALQWGYEADHPFDKEGRAFQKAGVPYYVCPGTSSWNSIGGRTDNALANLRLAAESGLRHGAIGYLITDWGDNGHLQYLPVSYLGFAAGAAYSWCLQSNRVIDLPTVLNHHAFKDPTGNLGQTAFDLGNVYRACGKANANGSALFRLLVPNPGDPVPEKGMTEEGFASAEAALNGVEQKLLDNRTGELKLVTEEFQHAIRILRLCISIGRQKLGLPDPQPQSAADIAAKHRELWLARNRPGGLEESVGRILAQTLESHDVDDIPAVL